jgi:glycosyltransferase involved in cell wall biosynthesis
LPRVTVVIPCFNQGQYVDEAVSSVLSQTFTDLEIVIVDDGSTDRATRALLDNYSRPKTTILRTDNAGPSTARNRGIALGTGEYILPLDADDRIDETYLEKAVRRLDANAELGIVYCRARHFGARTDDCEFKPYGFPDILWENMIFVSGVFRRSDWHEVGGYRTAMREGWEDWDFWLSLVERGRQVDQIPETLFFYRVVAAASRNKTLYAERARTNRMFRTIVQNHLDLYAAHVNEMYERRYDKGTFLEGRERLAARVAIAALLRPWRWRQFPSEAKGGAALLAWAAYAPIRRLKELTAASP